MGKMLGFQLDGSNEDAMKRLKEIIKSLEDKKDKK